MVKHEVSYYLGFDPGGNGTFGWAVTRSDDLNEMELVASGCASDALHAVTQALGAVPKDAVPMAAGIDAPLFWTPTGFRTADKRVREVLRVRKAPSPAGTVQHLNSLRGACLVQGVAAAILLRQHVPAILLTETHPKALLWHLKLAHRERAPRDVRVDDVPGLHVESASDIEHVRDAVFSCYAALSLHKGDPQWHDLACLEHDAIWIVPGAVSYWMPKIDLAVEAAHDA